jgi:hypothetical protein
LSLLDGLPASKNGYRYAPGKWTTWEVIRHIVDVEWVMAFRALHFSRQRSGAIPGMEQDEFIAAVASAKQSMSALKEEYRHLRAAVMALFGSFNETLLNKKGVASGNSFTVRSLIYIIAGHERHHVNVLKERYL